MRESTLRRGLSILSEFENNDGGAILTVANVAERLGIHRSQVSRTLQVLCDEGFVDRADRGYALGWKLYVLGHRAGSERLIQLAEAALTRLAAAIDERCYLAVRQGTSIMVVLSVSSGNAVEVADWVGHERPAYTTSTGRALLIDASLEDLERLFGDQQLPQLGDKGPYDVRDLYRRILSARRQGFAVADEEITEGVVSAAAPIRAPNGRVIAALGFASPRYRMSKNRISEAIEELCIRSAQISLALSSRRQSRHAQATVVLVSLLTGRKHRSRQKRAEKHGNYFGQNRRHRDVSSIKDE